MSIYNFRKQYEEQGIPVHSYSSLSLYESCGYCYYLKYVCGIKQKWISHNLLFGIIIHKILEDVEILNDTNKLDNLIDETIEKNLYSKYLEGSSIAQVKANVEKTVKMLCENPIFRKNKTPVIKKKKELEVFVPMKSWVLHAKIDGVSDQNELIEHKTSSSKYNLNRIRESHQHILYQIAFKHTVGMNPNQIIYDIIYKSANPIREQFLFNVSDREVEKTLSWANNIAEQIGKKNWKPSKPIGWQHKSWCDHKNLCGYCSGKWKI